MLLLFSYNLYYMPYLFIGFFLTIIQLNLLYYHIKTIYELTITIPHLIYSRSCGHAGK